MHVFNVFFTKVKKAGFYVFFLFEINVFDIYGPDVSCNQIYNERSQLMMSAAPLAKNTLTFPAVKP